jgi:putative FmdB family regulatory protein
LIWQQLLQHTLLSAVFCRKCLCVLSLGFNMPIYEYQCKECGHQLEAIQRFSDAALTQCPACHQQSLSKQISAPSFRLKGGGWYETDFKTANKRHGTQDADGSVSGSKPEAAKSETASSGTSKTDTSKKDSSSATV